MNTKQPILLPETPKKQTLADYEESLSIILATMPWRERQAVDRIADSIKKIVEGNGNNGIIALSVVFQGQVKKP